MLGSNLPDDGRVHEALRMLAAMGTVHALGPVCQLQPRDGRGARYHNVLATLDATMEEDELRHALRQMERGLGRRRGTVEVAIDIDLLAVEIGGLWRAARHATLKGEIGSWPASQLLQDAGLHVHPPGDACPPND